MAYKPSLIIIQHCCEHIIPVLVTLFDLFDIHINRRRSSHLLPLKLHLFQTRTILYVAVPYRNGTLFHLS